MHVYTFFLPGYFKVQYKSVKKHKVCPIGDDRAASVAVPRLVDVRASGLEICGQVLELVSFRFRASGLMIQALGLRG